MSVKLHINISQGLIEVEGDADLVREVYSDFRDHLLNGKTTPAQLGASEAASINQETTPSKSEEASKQKPKSKRRSSAKKKSPVGDEGPIIIADQPRLDKNLDTSALPAYYGQFEPKNNPEKILIFLKFMKDELQIEAPNTDQFYTCFEKVNERVPKAFSQTFRDASGRRFGFIDYNSPLDIKLTTTGSNHFKFDLKKRSSE